MLEELAFTDASSGVEQHVSERHAGQCECNPGKEAEIRRMTIAVKV